MTDNALPELDTLLAKIAQILGRPLSSQEVGEAISQSAAGLSVDAIARSIEQLGKAAENAATMEKIMLVALKKPDAETSNGDRAFKSELRPTPRARMG